MKLTKIIIVSDDAYDSVLLYNSFVKVLSDGMEVDRHRKKERYVKDTSGYIYYFKSPYMITREYRGGTTHHGSLIIREHIFRKILDEYEEAVRSKKKKSFMNYILDYYNMKE